MASKVFQSPKVDSQTLVDSTVNVDARTSSVLAALKALSESHRVLEILIGKAYDGSKSLPLSLDQKLSILCLIAFLVYCFVMYPLFLCPTKDVPGPYFTSTAVGDQLHGYHKQKDNADQWSLSLHETYGSVVRLKPMLVSISDPSLARNLCSHSPDNSKPGLMKRDRHTTSAADPNLFGPTIFIVMEDLRLVMKGQKTVDVHDLLSRHLFDRAPASFAAALAHTIYQLAHPMHRHYLNRLAREIHAADDEDVPTLELLNAVVKESLRMQQAPNHHAPILVVPENGRIVGDHELQEGTEVVVSLYCASHNAAIFERPNDFNPTLWLRDGKEAQRMENTLRFILDYHRRIKLGFDATIEHLKLLLAALLRSFDMKLPLGEQPTQLDLVELRNGGCRVRFRERKQLVAKKVRFAEHAVM